MIIFVRLLIFFVLSLPTGLLAFPGKDVAYDCTKCHSLTVAEAGKILVDVGEVKSVRGSSGKGLWEIILEKDGCKGTAYMDFDKKHIIAGPIFDIQEMDSVYNSDSQGKRSGKIDLASAPLASSIVMGNPKGTKKLFLFTDPDCPICRKMHAELVSFEQSEEDIAIFVLLLPRPNYPDSYDKSRAILAGKSRALLDKALSGKAIIRRPGSSDGRRELDEIIHFARYSGITATPTLVLADGTVLAGFRDAESLKKLLKGEAATTVAPK